MCFMKPPKAPKVEAPPSPDDPAQATARRNALAAAGPGRSLLSASGPLGVPNFKGGATAMLTG